jgi:hypothetical protein
MTSGQPEPRRGSQSIYEAAKRIATNMVGGAELQRVRMAARIVGTRHGLRWRNPEDPSCDAWDSSGRGCPTCHVMVGESCDTALLALAIDGIAWAFDNRDQRAR